MSDKTTQQLYLTESLGVFGWSHLDAIFLAALASESPLLLIGAHGTAKTWLVEQMSHALNLEFRHYNASLINYDDLVGIPIPDEATDSLRFITTAGAIWNAEFVFFDEISRCRPDLQNKLFPIVHERKVIGLPVSGLQHRWAAMNPPMSEDPTADVNINEYYIGSENLDLALVDRFPFVVNVPRWNQLSREDRHRLVVGAVGDDQPTLQLGKLVAECQAMLSQIEKTIETWVGDYVICVMDLLDKAKLSQSPRRARMLAKSISVIHASRIVLAGGEVDIAESAEMGLLYCLPQTATDTPPSVSTLIAIHKQAWEIITCIDDENWRRILEETDYIKRVILAESADYSDEDMSKLVTQALNADASEARKVSLATAMFLAFQQHRTLTAACWEPLTRLAGRLLLPRISEYATNNNSAESVLWSEIMPFVINKRENNTFLSRLEANYVLGGFPDLWRTHNWREAVAQFVKDLEMFGIREPEND